MKKIGFKAFGNDWKCRDKQYTVGEEFTQDGGINLCGNGLHYCNKPLDVLQYYPNLIDNKYAIIEDNGDVSKSDDDKSVTNKLLIKSELSIKELFNWHFKLIFEKIETKKETTNTSGDYAHANTSGYEAIACSLGIKSKSKVIKGWIIIVDWKQDDNYNWYINNIHNAKVGNKILDIEIEPNVWYWFEDGELKSETC